MTEQPSRIRRLADAYYRVTGEHYYAGREDGARHYFSDGTIVGDGAALEHMVMTCQRAGIDTRGI